MAYWANPFRASQFIVRIIPLVACVWISGHLTAALTYGWNVGLAQFSRNLTNAYMHWCYVILLKGLINEYFCERADRTGVVRQFYVKEVPSKT